MPDSMQTITSIDVPLTYKDDGSIRIGNTRILLELVIRAFLRGTTPEGIVQSYPSLTIQQVYAVIAYYLQNKDEVDEYVKQVDIEGEQIRQMVEADQPDITSLRARLIKHMEQPE